MMISIKGGTQTFSDKPNSAALQGSGEKTLGSDELKKFYGDQDLGTILNKVADANWVDPSKKMRTAGNPDLDKDAFMKLLMTQIKYQDPSNPMQSHEMASQLAQFSSLEQMSNMNTGIQEMVKAQKPSQNFDALKMIGMAVRGDSSKISRGSLEDQHDIVFNLAKDANDVVLKIKDAQGNVVRELEAHNLKSGKNEISWNGEIDDGSKARPGDYSVDISAKTENTSIIAETAFEGVISGINFSPTGPVLMIGNKSVKLSDIKNIVDPSKVAQNNGNVTKVEAKAVENKDTAPQKVQTNLDGVAMSREVINELKKSGAETKAF